MHIYIYDDFVSDKKHDSIRNKLETRITDLGLSGKIIRLGLMKDTFSAVKQEISRGAKTIVAVGNNKIVNQTLNSIIYSEKNNANLNIPLGIIPVDEKNNDIAFSLGIDSIEEACNIISARRIKTLDVGVITPKTESGLQKEQYFLSEIKISNNKTTIEVDKKFSVENKKDGFFNIINLLLKNNNFNIKSNPQDGILELLVLVSENKKIFKKNKYLEKESVFPFKKITVNSDFKEITINNKKISTPFEISVLKKRINLIVGKNRNF